MYILKNWKNSNLKQSKEEARADVRIRVTFEEFVKIGNFIDGSIVVSPGISRVNHWWPYLKRPHTTHGHGFEHVRDRLVDDRAFFAFSVDSPLYLRRKSCYRTSVPASFMITSDTLVPWRWKNAHENWSRRAFPIKLCRSSLTPLLYRFVLLLSFAPLTSLQNISLSDISISLMDLSFLTYNGLKFKVKLWEKLW